MIPLLDVNVLIALAWPNHVHHGAATAWFAEKSASGWATCPLTESGFIRISSNRGVIPTAQTPGDAIAVLRALRAQGRWQFWTDDVSLTDAVEIDMSRVIGHRQVTDAHLLVLAIRNNGRLATFDRGVGSFASSEDQVELLSI